jgi:hypothetical protein
MRLQSDYCSQYYIFGGFNFAAFVHVWFMFPETVGRTLEVEVFDQGHVFAVWKIERDVGSKTLQDIKSTEGRVNGAGIVSNGALTSAVGRWLTNTQEHAASDRKESAEHHEKV